MVGWCGVLKVSDRMKVSTVKTGDSCRSLQETVGVPRLCCSLWGGVGEVHGGIIIRRRRRVGRLLGE